MGTVDRPTGARFVFEDWARFAAFEYPIHAAPFMALCGSPAEAYFLRRLFESPATLYGGADVVHCRGAAVRVQVPCEPYRIDVVAERQRVRLAIEVDGYAYHNANKTQVAADYWRARRLLAAGYIVIRFTAAEAMSKSAACWIEVFSVLDAHCALQRSA